MKELLCSRSLPARHKSATAGRTCGARGFTLIELMLVMTLAGTLLVFAAAGYGDYLKRQRVIATANEFFHALGLARAQAMQRGGRVVLAPLDGLNWNSGWQVFAKDTANRDLRHESGDLVLLMHARPPAGVVIATNLANPHIAYNGAGRAQSSMTGAGVFGTLQFSAEENIRRIRIAPMGRARLCNPEADKTCEFSGSAAPAQPPAPASQATET